jgi:hypothetical protein
VATWALIDTRFRLMLGLRGTALPGAGLYGGGPVVGAEFTLWRFFSLFAIGAAEGYPARNEAVLALLGALGVAARF